MPPPLRPPAPAAGGLLTGPIVIVAAAGIAGLVAALLAVLRNHERGLLVAIPVLWGLVVTFFTVGELAFPHRQGSVNAQRALHSRRGEGASSPTSGACAGRRT